jgi:hypothetical protein
MSEEHAGNSRAKRVVTLKRIVAGLTNIFPISCNHEVLNLKVSTSEVTTNNQKPNGEIIHFWSGTFNCHL